MRNERNQVKIVNTLTGEYENVEVTEEVATFLKRSYWKEEKQKERYKNFSIVRG